MAQRDTDLIVKRILVGIFALLSLGAGAIAVTACVRAYFVHGDPPIMLVGILGGLAGIAAGLFLARTAMRPSRL